MEKPQPSFLVRLITHQIGLKILSLGLALVAWFSIRSFISYETVVTNVPMTILLDDGLAILNRSVNTVDIAFRGSRDSIQALDRSQVRVEVDLRGKTPEGARQVRLLPKHVVVSGLVRPVSVQPPEVALMIDREVERQVEVKPNLVGTPPTGYEVSAAACRPASVTLSGPRQRLQYIESIRTAAVDIDGRIRSFRKPETGIVMPGENWSGRVTPTNVSVEVVIQELTSTRIFKDMPVLCLTLPGTRPPALLAPAQATVTLRGPETILTKLSRDDVLLYVPLAAVENLGKLSVKVFAPEGVRVETLEPPVVELKQR